MTKDMTAITALMDERSKIEVVDTTQPMGRHLAQRGYTKDITAREWCEAEAKRIRRRGGNAWVHAEHGRVCVVRSTSEVKDE